MTRCARPLSATTARGFLSSALHVSTNASAGIVLDATGALMGADDRAVDHPHIRIVSMRDGSQNTIPNACAVPTHEAIVRGGLRAVAFKQTVPGRSRPQDPENAAPDTPFIHPRNASSLAGKDWCYRPPASVGKGVSHIQGCFWELESCRHAKLQCLPWPRHYDLVRQGDRPRGAQIYELVRAQRTSGLTIVAMNCLAKVFPRC